MSRFSSDLDFLQPLEARPVVPANITFGINLSLITTRRVPLGGRSFADKLLCARVAESLNIQPGVVAGLEPSGKNWTISPQSSILYAPAEVKGMYRGRLDLVVDDTLPGFLFTTQDRTVQIEHSGILLRSPVFLWTAMGAPRWRRQVNNVIHAVTSGDFRSAVNKSTGLHVSIGVGEGKCPSLPELQKILAVLILSENALAFGGTEDGRTVPNRRLRHFLGQTNEEVFDIIMAQTSIKGLQKAVNATPVLTATGCQTTWNRELNMILDVRTGMVEVRSYQSCLCPREIEMWVGLLCNLVCNAAKAEIMDLRCWLAERKMDSKTLLEKLVKNPVVSNYYRRKLAQGSMAENAMQRANFCPETRTSRIGLSNTIKRTSSLRRAMSSASSRLRALTEVGDRQQKFLKLR